MSMHIGGPCTPAVKRGEEVMVGQVIGTPSGIAAPIHSSVSGKVKTVKQELLGTGFTVDVVTIANDGQNTIHPDAQVPPVITDHDSFIQAVKASGMVGLGGAGFPTWVKLNPPKDKSFDTLIVNAMECESYITTDERIMLEEPDVIIAGLERIMKWIDVPRCIIGIEDNKPEAARLLREEIATRGAADRISVDVVPTRYPQGAEKTLIQALTGRIIPTGGLPADVSVVVLNVTTVNALEHYFRTGMPLVSKAVTLDGDAVASPGNYRVPIGASIADLVEAAGGFAKEPKKVIMGGPMMGVSVSTLETAIIKNNNAILCFHDKMDIPDETACIRCGRCIRSCPMELMPNKLDAAARRKDFERLDRLAVMNCVECGVCTFVCPAHRQLIQNIRAGKIVYRDELSARQEANK